VKIYSSIPGGNTYGDKDGTSMASPVVAGLASLILSYYPDLSAAQVKRIMEQSAMKPSKTSFTKPGTEDEKTSLDQLSITGGIINALDALKLASTTTGERKSTQEKTEKTTKKTKKQ
jgi:subtilisin family serine protease